LSKFSPVFKGMGIVTSVVAVGVILGFLGHPPPGAMQSTRETPAKQAKQTEPAGRLANPQKLASTQKPTDATTTPVIAQFDWEDEVNSILSSDDKADAKADQLVALFPTLPEEGQIEAAQELFYMLSDHEFAAFEQYLANASLSAPVLNLLMTGALNRPDNVKLPILLEVARNDANPKAADARELLRGFLGTDYGTDWAQWKSGIEKHLGQNPE
jgi:hypothetical protein